MALSAGRLRHEIVITEPVEVDDDTGGSTIVWRKVDDCRAEVIGLAGREAMIEKTLQGVRVYRITIRWRDEIGAKCQIYHAGENLNVRSAHDPDGRRFELVIIADTEATIS